MEKKKQYVLWVVHTDMEEPSVYPHTASDFRKIGPPPKSLYGIKLKSMNRLHRESVVLAMKAAQEAGMNIVYEAEDRGNRFMKWAKAQGVNTAAIIRIHYNPEKYMSAKNNIVDTFLRTLIKKGISNPEIIFAGHHADICILDRAEGLKKRGFRPYLIIGTAVMYGDYDLLNGVKAKFEKKRRITINQLRKL